MTKPSDEQTAFVSERSLELMGGREAAIDSMEKEYYELKERWKQDIDTIGRILRAHLHVEYYLTEHLQHINPGLGDIDEARLSFAQKSNLLSQDGDALVWMLIGGIRHLNKIRNRLAHNLKAEVTEDDRTVFFSQGIYKAMRDWGHTGDPKPLSDAPIDVLEHFAEFASSILHSRTTLYSKAFAQAMNEWVTKNEKK